MTTPVDTRLLAIYLNDHVSGATVGVLSGGPPLRRALRQLAIGAGAATTTYLLGALFGTLTG